MSDTTDDLRSALPALAQCKPPPRIQAALFVAKTWCFRTQRWLLDPAGTRPRRLTRREIDMAAPALAVSRTPLYSDGSSGEFALQAGKVQNLRMAARHLNGLIIPAGGVFSFWTQVPRPTRRRGFAPGRELREGCLVPSIGGGLCQLSNALYDAALTAGCEIVERHAHSRHLPGSMAAIGRDATLFWNYVDLRFRPAIDCQLEVSLGRSELTVALRRLHGSAARPTAPARNDRTPKGVNHHQVGSCDSCGVTTCFRHEDAPVRPAAVTVWLVDGWWPEHDAYLSRQAASGDWLFTPLDSLRLGIGPYRWSSAGFAAVRQAPWFVAARSWRSRRLAQQGAARQRALLAMDEALARLYARRLPSAATHLVVSQTLLPFLWRDGVLGGRSFDVLMTRLPLAELQATLDRAAKAWPQSPTLADFRADPALLEAEAAALAAARKWITPHGRIAALAGAKAEKLAWQLPPMPTAGPRPGRRIRFPASTLGRKGAYELREVVRDLNLSATLTGPVLENADFWNGVAATRAEGDRLGDGPVVVLPAWVEDQPRRLLRAIGAGVPVIASDACGLEGVPGVTIIPAGDASALRRAVAEAMTGRDERQTWMSGAHRSAGDAA